MGQNKVDHRPALIYCRESRDERSEHYERIETQRDILMEFCRRRGLVNVVDIILDDDCTGTDFRRFDTVIERVRRKELQVIVFKDASRLGRNLKESLNFRDLMEECGAEILFESEEYSEDFFPLKAWFNEQRAKEDSQKIRRVLRHKMEGGTLLVKPFYGYVRGEGNTLVPKEETAQIVRWIFREVQQGKSANEVACALNEKGVPTPSQAAGYGNAMDHWVGQHIRRIVTNPVYIGTMTHHKSSKKSFKSKKTVRHGEEEWIVLEHHHEALVSEELFAQVQNTRRKFRQEKGREHPFSGLLQCGRCGKNLVLRRGKDRPAAYICGRNHREGTARDGADYGCSPHHVRVEVLYEAVLRYWKMLLRDADVDMDDMLRRISKPQTVYDRLREQEKKLEQVQNAIDRIYEDKITGLIHETLFSRKYQEYLRQEQALRRQIEEGKKEAERGEAARLTDFRLEDIINALSVQSVTKERLRSLFERIVVFEAGEIPSAELWGLTEEAFETVRAVGGILFVENTQLSDGTAAPYHITAGWL